MLIRRMIEGYNKLLKGYIENYSEYDFQYIERNRARFSKCS